jgi:aminoglycoside phosphotransferase family enzyme/predicted kinase
MDTGDQSEVIDFLASPRAHGGLPVERVDTHTAAVFLAGSRAWKLKRAVRYDYLDFSTVERRRHCCEAEVRLNRRTAPALYRGVSPVTRERSGALAIGGDGTAVDWLVEMQRFNQDDLFDRMAAAHRLGEDVMAPLATAIAGFHRAAEHRADHGGTAGMMWVIDGNAAGFAEFAAAGLDRRASASLTQDAAAEVERHGALLDERRRSGQVRQCHGDLHLRNIVLIDGRPTLFDGVEFNDKISCVDVLYDLAFLVMDLWRRRLSRHANVVLNRYMTALPDLDALRLLPLFLSCRAAVRAKTSATAAHVQADAGRRREMQETAGEYLRLAADLLRPPRPSLLAIGGFSGTGKSTAAQSLAPELGPVPGAIVLRSDEIRKELCGVPPLQRLGPEGYTPEVSERVYRVAIDRARTVVRNGHAAIVDAVFAQPGQRTAIERAASGEHVPFAGCWLRAPEAVLAARTRQRVNDPSDADAEIVRRQHMQDTGDIGWHTIDASRQPDAVAAEVLAMAGRLLFSRA